MNQPHATIFLFTAALCMAAALANAIVLTAFDEAAFYAKPGETPNVTELEYDNATIYLVAMNGTPVALLRGSNENYTPIVDLITLTRAMWINSEAVENATNTTADAVIKNITSSADRIEDAIKAKLAFWRSQEFYEFERQRANVTAEYANPRKVALAELERLVEGMQLNLANLQRARTRDAAERYAEDFDSYHAKAKALLRQYKEILPTYRNMVVTMIGASSAIETNVRRGLMTGEEAASAQHDIDALWSDVISVEATLVGGKSINNGTRETLSNITGRVMTITAPPKRESGFPGWALIVVGLAFLGVIAFGAYVYRTKIISKAAAISPAVTDKVSSGLDTVNRKLRDIERME